MKIVEHDNHDREFAALGTMDASGIPQAQCREFFADKYRFVTPCLYDGDVLLWYGTDQRAGITVEDIEAIVVLGHDHAITDAKLVLWQEVYPLPVRIEALLQGAVQCVRPDGTDIEWRQDFDISAWINCERGWNLMRHEVDNPGNRAFGVGFFQKATITLRSSSTGCIRTGSRI